jgi:peptide/nickel transport system permease protein
MRYIARRLVFYLVAIWASITLNFAIPHLMPGNPAEAIFASHAQQMRGNSAALHSLEVTLGLSNDPLPVQYWHYLVNLAHGDLGISFSFFPSHVWTIIADRLPWTILLVGIASLLSALVGISLGMIVAWRRGGLLDSILPPVTLLLGSFPFFFLALLLLYVISFQLKLLPLNGAYNMDTQPNLSLGFIGDAAQHAILPAASIILVSVGGWILGMRNTMINILAEDYVTMAEAKGLTGRRIMFMYAARNALLPQITGFALSLGYLVGGQILIEYVFSYPGVGYLLATAIGSQDYPLIQGLLLVITLGVLLANLVADLLYGRFDPRVRAAW